MHAFSQQRKITLKYGRIGKSYDFLVFCQKQILPIPKKGIEINKISRRHILDKYEHAVRI